MSLTAIERRIAFSLRESGDRQADRMSATKLIALAVQRGVMTPAIALQVDQLRKVRNEYAHYQKSSRFWRRLNELTEKADDDGPDVNQIVHEDAQTAIRLVSTFFRSVAVPRF